MQRWLPKSKMNLLTRPLFITLEGGEGAGKGVQKYRLAEFIQNNDNEILGTKYSDVILSREPTNYSKAGRTFNTKLANKIPMSAKEQLKYVSDDRFEHDPVIRYQLAAGKFYISDRFFDSTGAYQVLEGVSWEDVIKAHKIGEEGSIIIPDITIYFSISVKTSLERTKDRKVKDTFDEKVSLITNLDDAYKFWFKKTSHLMPQRRLIIVNGEQSIEKVAQEMIAKIIETIKKDYDFFKPS